MIKINYDADAYDSTANELEEVYKLINPLRPLGIGSTFLMDGALHVVCQVLPGIAQLVSIDTEVDTGVDVNRNYKQITLSKVKNRYDFSFQQIVDLLGGLDVIIEDEVIPVNISIQIHKRRPNGNI